jgi:hypothetical protein
VYAGNTVLDDDAAQPTSKVTQTVTTLPRCMKKEYNDHHALDGCGPDSTRRWLCESGG